MTSLLSILSLLVVAIGMVIVINTIRGTRNQQQGFPRHHETVRAGRRFLSVLLGVIITLCGGGMFVISRLD